MGTSQVTDPEGTSEDAGIFLPLGVADRYTLGMGIRRHRPLPATQAGVATIEIRELVEGGLLVKVHASEPALAFVDGLLDMKRLTPAQSAAIACANTLNESPVVTVVVQ